MALNSWERGTGVLYSSYSNCREVANSRGSDFSMKARYQLQAKYDSLRPLTRCHVLVTIIASLTGWLTGYQLVRAATVPTMMQTYRRWSVPEVNQESLCLLAVTTVLGLVCWGLAAYLNK
jgi:hypothetical protein